MLIRTNQKTPEMVRTLGLRQPNPDPAPNPQPTVDWADVGKRSLVLAPLGAAVGYTAGHLVAPLAPYGLKALAAGTAGVATFVGVALAGSLLSGAVGWALKSESPELTRRERENRRILPTAIGGISIVGGLAAGVAACGTILYGSHLPLLAISHLPLAVAALGTGVGMTLAYHRSQE
ncbi:hypothetical protein IV102_18290 [bacterium]|nr:hypothetical protein [bacterium]